MLRQPKKVNAGWCVRAFVHAHTVTVDGRRVWSTMIRFIAPPHGAIFGGVYLSTRYLEELGVITGVLLPLGTAEFCAEAPTSYIEANAPGLRKAENARKIGVGVLDSHRKERVAHNFERAAWQLT
jgi:hypothetical protein